MIKPRVSLMLDSGAFGAWKRDETLDLKKYIRFIKDNEQYVTSYVNMDVIPGSMGKMNKSQREVEESAQKSYDNQQIIKRAGLHPIPVFHQGEQFHWLERLMDDGEPYIGISPYKNAAPKDIRLWLDHVFTLLTDAKGLPLVKTHGFGMTSPRLLMRYPWFTIDSAAWALGAAYGHVLIPSYVNGKFDYLRPHLQVIITGRTQTSASQQRRHFDGLSPLAQKHVTLFLEQVVGIDISQARNNPEMRRLAYLHFFVGLQNQIGSVRFLHRHNSIKYPDHKPITIKNATIIFATGTTSAGMSIVLTDAKIWNRLLSYYELKDKRPNFVSLYVKTGLIPGHKYRPAKQDKWGSQYVKHRTLKLVNRLARSVHGEEELDPF
jgi:hypothetical protein